MKTRKIVAAAGLLFALALFLAFRFTRLASESRDVKPTLGVVDGSLQDCHDRANCVSSEAGDRRVDSILDNDGSVWERLATIVAKMDQARLVDSTENYIRFEFSTWVFGFVDDMEFRRDRASGTIEVRSASRVGHSDLGMNRRRVESIRALLEQ